MKKKTLLLFALLAIVSCGGTNEKENRKLHYDEHRQICKAVPQR
jgi:hypothetical protein